MVSELDQDELQQNTELIPLLHKIQQNPLYIVPFGDMSTVSNTCPDMTLGELQCNIDELLKSFKQLLFALSLMHKN